MTESTLPTRTLERVLLLTAFAAGAVDIITFARLGGILASAMTGNLAFFGYYLSRLAFFSALGSFIALCGFVLGGAAGTLLSRGHSQPRALRTLLSAEAVLLIGAVILWLTTPHAKATLPGYLVITCLSLGMGLQSIAGKRIALSNIPTVVFTSTLTNIVVGITEMLAEGRKSLKEDTVRQLQSFGLYFAGALIAGICAYLNVLVIILLPAIAIAGAVWACMKAPTMTDMSSR
jgi:uncharacterized membrane protein YoaK (UPF0700 family)